MPRAGCGHVLLEGVPGVAKTLTVTTLAHVISASFQRIQLTPDMMPADIVGTRIYDATTSTFRDRTRPDLHQHPARRRNQSRHAQDPERAARGDAGAPGDAGGHTFELEDPFWVLATQNPVEQEGVYTLPEAQLDRFSMMLKVTYPSEARRDRDASDRARPCRAAALPGAR